MAPAGRSKKKGAWVRTTVVIQNELGLHVRPAALFVRLANKFRSEVILRKGRERVNGKSITGVLLLGCEKGSEVEVTAIGQDAERAVKELSELLSQDLAAMERTS
ncbi:MAG: HPr family phosphocarrier protein [Candidatus Omnitrophota bacterium]